MRKFTLGLLFLTTLLALAQNTIVEQATDIFIRNTATNAVALRVVKPIANVAPFIEFGSQTNTVFSVSSLGVIAGNGSGITNLAASAQTPIGQTVDYAGFSATNIGTLTATNITGVTNLSATLLTNVSRISAPDNGTVTNLGNLNVTGTISAGGLSMADGGINANSLTLVSGMKMTPYFRTNTTALEEESLNYCNAQNGSFTVTLPDAASVTLTPFFTLIRTDTNAANTVTIDSSGGLVNGLASVTLLPFQAYTFVSDDTNWNNASDSLGNAIRVGADTITNNYVTTFNTNITVKGTTTIGDGGTAFSKVLSAAAALNFGNTANGAAESLTITVTGAAVGDVVSLGIPHGSVPAGCVNFLSWVSAADTVTVRFCNNSGGALDPGSATFRAVVTKF